MQAAQTGSALAVWLGWLAGLQILLLAIGGFGWQTGESLDAVDLVPAAPPGTPDKAPIYQEAEGIAGDPGAGTEETVEVDPVPPEPVVESRPAEPQELLPEPLEIPEPPPAAQLDLVEALPRPEPPPPAPSPAPTPTPTPAPAPAAPAGSSAQASSGNATESPGSGGSGSQGGGGGSSGAIQQFRGGGGGSFPAPDYPTRSRRRGEQGMVLLYVEVAANGRPQVVSVVRSSGHSNLDREASRTVRRWRWDNGPARYHVPITFRLD